MPCLSPQFVGNNEHHRTWSNWNGDVTFTAAEYWQPKHSSADGPPDGLASLTRVVADASTQDKRLHAIGSGWAFEDIAASDDWVVNLDFLKRRLTHVVGDSTGAGPALTDDWARAQVTPNQPKLVHVEAGIKVIDLVEQLDTLGLALPTLGGANGQALAGVVSTSTHGGDWQQGPFPDLVRAVHLVVDGGRELWIERHSAPVTTDDRLRPQLSCPDVEIIRDDAIFEATIVSFGRIGIIYALVLEVTQKFMVVEVATMPSRSTVLAALRAGLGSALPFEPLFAALRADPTPSLGTDDDASIRDAAPTFFQLVFNSLQPEDLWVQRRWRSDGPDLNAVLPLDWLCSPGLAAPLLNVASGLLSGLAGVVFNIPIVGPILATAMTAKALEFLVESAEPGLTGGKAVADALNAIWSLPLGERIAPQLNRAAVTTRFDKAMTEGRRAAHHLLTSGTREASESNCYKADSVEVIFPATTGAYIDFLEVIQAAGTGFKQAGYISLRYSGTSRATMSMHNLPGPFAVSIEVATLAGLPDNKAWMNFVQGAALQRGGRMHWGQINRITADQVLHGYGAQLIRWREALLRVSRFSNRFSNHFTRQRGLEPSQVIREVVAVHRSPHGVVLRLCGQPGSPWSPVAVADAVHDIESGAITYFTTATNRVAVVEVVHTPHGTFLRTSPDDTAANNLDSLPECVDAGNVDIDDANFVSQTVPPDIPAGGQRTVAVTMYNSGSSAWEPGSYALALAAPWPQAVAPAPVTMTIAPLQQATFSLSVPSGPAGTRATLSMRMIHQATPFGDATEPAVIAFTAAGEPEACSGIRSQIADLDRQIATLSDAIDPENVHEAARIRRTILQLQARRSALVQQGEQLHCTLA